MKTYKGASVELCLHADRYDNRRGREFKGLLNFSLRVKGEVDGVCHSYGVSVVMRERLAQLVVDDVEILDSGAFSLSYDAPSRIPDISGGLVVDMFGIGPEELKSDVEKACINHIRERHIEYVERKEEEARVKFESGVEHYRRQIVTSLHKFSCEHDDVLDAVSKVEKLERKLRHAKSAANDAIRNVAKGEPMMRAMRGVAEHTAKLKSGEGEGDIPQDTRDELCRRLYEAMQRVLGGDFDDLDYDGRRDGFALGRVFCDD